MMEMMTVESVSRRVPLNTHAKCRAAFVAEKSRRAPLNAAQEGVGINHQANFRMDAHGYDHLQLNLSANIGGMGETVFRSDEGGRILNNFDLGIIGIVSWKMLREGPSRGVCDSL